MLETACVEVTCLNIALDFGFEEHQKAGLEMKAVSLNGRGDMLQCLLHK